ncbi:MAG: lipopolysaccharide heptosyltransferase II [Arsenophonus sp.]|nr:MAG: lipopolysaccharide heptosyltransferase II [Arsenophonus sp.]
MKILVISPSWIGDTMMSQSFYRTFKKNNPNSEIHVITIPYCAELLNYFPEINKIIIVNLKHGKLEITKRYKIGKLLRNNIYNQAFILPNSFKSAIIPMFAKISIRTGWIGEMRYGILNDIRTYKKKFTFKTAEKYGTLAYKKKTINCAEDIPKPILWPSIKIKKSNKKIKEKFKIFTKKNIIGFCPHSASGINRCWPFYHFATLAKLLLDTNLYQIILFGCKKDILLSKKICSLIPYHNQKNCIDLTGKTSLKEVIILLNICNIVVTNDSGLMHISAALNKSIVAIYGTTNPEKNPPLSKKIRIITSKNKFDNIVQNKKKYHKNFINIKPEEVFKNIQLFG